MSNEGRKGPEPYRMVELLEWLNAHIDEDGEVEVPSIRALSEKTGIPARSLEWSVKRLGEMGKLQMDRPSHWSAGPVTLKVTA